MQQQAVSDVFRALADPTRRAVFERLSRKGEATVVELTATAGVSQPAVSQHLKALRLAGLVSERRAGRNTHYRAEPKNLAPLVDWIARQEAFWRERLTHLNDLLKEMDG
jgi:DNA-binding transcriptional ArsR family regulator